MNKPIFVCDLPGFHTAYSMNEAGQATYDTKLYISRYIDNGALALFEGDEETDYQGTLFTVNVPGHVPPHGHVLIKTWSENEGVYEELLRHGVILEKVREVPTGFVTAFLCPLNLKRFGDVLDEL